MKTKTFANWKKDFSDDPWFRSADNYLRAVSIVFNAYLSRRDGELTPEGCKAAVGWAYKLSPAAAHHEDHRAATRNYYVRTQKYHEPAQPLTQPPPLG